ncbi:hypothetical protein B0T17DRAFT_628914 [Bombardia bombarda]|uniref:Uncharacterized protein n=1 Tax=Bombardia bombarda TaxID=252184 RepID=A0AA39WCM6_9PEZI|nr:hypothetical protein B0T17DRAFT_628914 [Bombardia bombarda]
MNLMYHSAGVTQGFPPEMLFRFFPVWQKERQLHPTPPRPAGLTTDSGLPLRLTPVGGVREARMPCNSAKLSGDVWRVKAWPWAHACERSDARITAHHRPPPWPTVALDRDAITAIHNLQTRQNIPACLSHILNRDIRLRNRAGHPEEKTVCGNFDNDDLGHGRNDDANYGDTLHHHHHRRRYRPHCIYSNFGSTLNHNNKNNNNKHTLVPPSAPAPRPQWMPFDRPSSTATTNSRLPTVARGLGKPPLTPKIAARATTPQNQTTSVITPQVRRNARPESAISSSNSHANSNTAPARDRDDFTSPVSLFVNNNNITPRSGSRQTRVDSTNTTPNGTPNPERPDAWEARSAMGISPSGTGDGPRRPMVTFSPSSEVGSARQDPDSKFFYAFDAKKPSQQATSSRPPPAPLQKPATFFYANGGAIPPRATSPAPLTPMLASPQPQDDLMSKFVYANGTPDFNAPAKPSFSQRSRPSSVVSTSSRVTTSRQPPAVLQAPYTSQRSTSPVKSQLLPYPPAKSASTPGLVSPRSLASPVSPMGSQPTQWRQTPDVPSRKVSGGSSHSHARTGSLVIAEPPAVARIMSAHSSLPSSEGTTPPNDSAPSSFPSNPASIGFASLLQAAEDSANNEELKSESLNSPAKSVSQETQLTDLVASARRERKVQDLQITNASLEAINRTLERQLRKQTAEIRRFKRLSRSGRLSLASMGSRVVSDSTVDGGALARAGLGLDDLSEEESELEAEEDDFDDDDLSSSGDSAELSPNTVAFRDARHRKRDEQRLQLDLSKHQQLLVDSQKINQSLKRCLGWTEELIKDGKRALEYKVRVSDVELGGRVLAPEVVEAREAGEDADDDDDEHDFFDGTQSELGEHSDNETCEEPWIKETQDRDSGIVLPKDGG